MQKDHYQKLISGFFVRDGSLGPNTGKLTLLLVEEPNVADSDDEGTNALDDDKLWRTRVLSFNFGNPTEGRYFAASANNLNSSSVACAWNTSHAEAVVVDIYRKVWVMRDKQRKGDEPEIPFKAGKLHPDAYGEFGGAITKTTRVGASVFAIGGPWRIFERIANQEWKEHEEIPIPVEIGSPDRDVYINAVGNCEFFDLAGLSTDDMYAVGSAGTVWRRKGGQWRQLAFPSNLRLHTVAVAPDGNAYITDIRGSVWQGQDEKWQRIVHADNMLAYQDSAWFAGRLWCTNDSAGPFVLEGKQMVPAHRAKSEPMPAQIANFAHRIDVAPDGKTMLVAGMQGAALYDGKTWTVLFDGEPDA